MLSLKSKKQAVEQIAEKMKLVEQYLAEANELANEAGIDPFEDNYEVDSEKEEKYDPQGYLYSLRGWNASSC